MEVTQLIYTSVAIRDMELADIEAIMTRSLAWNTRMEITGLLVYFRQSAEFIQLLEGGREAVLDLYENSIKKDPRHRNVRTFYTGTSELRICPDWSMSFRLENDCALRDRLNVSDFVDGGPLGGDEKAISRRLMIAYRDEVERFNK